MKFIFSVYISEEKSLFLTLLIFKAVIDGEVIWMMDKNSTLKLQNSTVWQMYKKEIKKFVAAEKSIIFIII
jgi:hypothetical protein